MCTQMELDMIVRRLAEIYRSVYGDDLVKVVLYGSYARGDFKADSDIDIVAIVQGDREALQEQLKRVWDESFDLGMEHEMILSPTVIPYEEYKKYQNDLPYYRNIEREGVLISA